MQDKKHFLAADFRPKAFRTASSMASPSQAHASRRRRPFQCWRGPSHTHLMPCALTSARPLLTLGGPALDHAPLLAAATPGEPTTYASATGARLATRGGHAVARAADASTTGASTGAYGTSDGLPARRVQATEVAKNVFFPAVILPVTQAQGATPALQQPPPVALQPPLPALPAPATRRSHVCSSSFSTTRHRAASIPAHSFTR